MQTSALKLCSVVRGCRVTPATIALGLLVAFGFAQTTGAQSAAAQSNVNPLSFGNNFFVTGDYVVAGAQGLGVNAPAQNGLAKGTITIPDLNPGITGTNQVPPGAQIVTALLYWQTVEKSTQLGTGQNGFFRSLFAGGPQTGYSISGATSSQNTVSFSGGGCTGSSGGKVVRTYRAEVTGYLPQDANGNLIVNGTDPSTGITYGKYEVLLANNPAATLPTLGATLVIIYRVLSPDVPLNSIVIYDGAFAPGNTLYNMTQTVQGFYDAAHDPQSRVSRLTHIVGNGHNYKFQTVYLNNVALPALYATGQPFPGYYGSWDNTTWTFPDPRTFLNPNSNPVPGGVGSVTTMVVPSSSTGGCVSWGAVIVSTTVENTDKDGLLDAWKTRHGYCDASINEGSCTVGKPSTGWVDLPGAMLGTSANPHKDVFVQLDYMCSILKSNGTCDTANGYSFNPYLALDPADNNKSVIQKVIDAFDSKKITLHIFPTHAVQEQSAPTGSVTSCTDIPAGAGQPTQLCAFPNQPGVVGWKGGLIFLKNQLVDTAVGNVDHDCTSSTPAATCALRFQHGKKDSWHYALFAHAIGLPNWTLQARTLTSVVQSGNTVSFKTSRPHGLTTDPSCDTSTTGRNGAGRVTVAFAITNPDLNGTYCVTSTSTSSANTAPDTFTISVATSTSKSYPLSTDPDLAVASGQASTVSGFSDVGGQDSVITLGSWKPQNQTWQAKTGTFMHELGHTLGLTHGGFYFDKLPPTAPNPPDYTPILEANCKPNHQSVMSYSFQIDLLTKFTGLDANRNPILVQVPDYSGLPLDKLDKSNPSPSLVFKTAPTYPITAWHGTASELGGIVGIVGSRMPVYCDGTPIPTGTDLYRVFRPIVTVPWQAGQLSWGASQNINLDGNANDSSVLRGHDDWNGTPTIPGIDLRQIGATGSLSAAGVGGLSAGGGVGGLSAGGGTKGLSAGGGVGGLSAGGGTRGLSGGGGTRGLSGGGGVSPLSAGGGTSEMTQAIAESVTRPPTNLIVTAEDASPRNVHLSWTAPTFGAIVKYKIYRSDAGGAFSLIGAVSGNPPATMFTDTTVPCNTAGHAYYVTAVIISDTTNQEQESVPSNTVSTIAPSADKLTGCYTLTAISLPPSPAVHGSLVPITWTLTDDFYTTDNAVNRAAANTSLVAIGPVPNNCTTTGPTPILLNGIPQGSTGTFPPASGGLFTFNLDTDGFCAGSYTFQLTLDSGQTQTTSALQLQIDVTDSDSTPHITTTSLRNATVGVPYSNILVADGGVGTLTWSIVGTPAPGIVFNPVTHTLLGTPIVPPPGGLNFKAQVYNFTVQVTDSAGNSGTQMLTLRTITAVSLNRTDYAAGLSPNGLISTDFNRDGKLDLAITNSGDNTVSILLGNGDGTFTAQLTLATGNVPYSLIARDFNNDGKLDLAVTNFANGATSTVSIFIGNGDGTFQPAVSYTVGSGPISVVAGDFNGDGMLDLAVANQNDQTVSILLGNGDGTFQSQVPYPAGVAGTLDVADLAVGDFNGDSKLDLAVTNPSTDQVSILLGNGDGTFQPPVAYLTGPTQSHPIAVTAADFNGDGKLDLAVTNLNTNKVAIFLGNGDGTFAMQVSYSTTSGAMTGPSAMTTGDFNGDGILDLAITNQNNNSAAVLLGNGNGTFQSPLEFPTGNLAAGVAAGDFNGDGRLDLAVADLTDNKVSVLLHLPQPPTNLVTASVTTTQVTLAWSPSATNVTGYNVYRATTSGGSYAKLNSTIVAASGFTDTVVHGTIYYYVVTAVAASTLESVFSNEVSATP